MPPTSPAPPSTSTGAAISTDIGPARPSIRISWWGDSLIAAQEAHDPALIDPYNLPPVGSTVTVTQWRHRGYAHRVAVALQARLPWIDIRTTNFAAAGATSTDVRNHIEATAPAHTGDFAVIGCGTNDVWQRLRTGDDEVATRARYEENLHASIQVLYARADRVLIVAPPPVGWLPGADTAEVNNELRRYGDAASAVADTADAAFVSAWERFTTTSAHLDRPAGKRPRPDRMSLWREDGVHLTDLGEHLLAEEVLRRLPTQLPERGR
ncbi:SGNH/GDSL hydrolase family protein [Nocardia sp. NPDC003345]